MDADREMVKAFGCDGLSRMNTSARVSLHKASVYRHFPAKTNLSKASLPVTEGYKVDVPLLLAC